MKKLFTLFAVLFLLSLTNTSYSQLSGTYTIPGSYATISAAITALNSLGVSGPVTFNVAAGHVEVGANYIINVTGPKPNATNTVTFQKSGAGANPRIETNAAGLGTISATGNGVNGDAFIKLNGEDFITFDGIDFTDLYTGASAFQKIEYGIMLCRASSTDGCKNITIRNCRIVFVLFNATSVSYGVYTANFNSAGTSTTATSIAGRHENIFIDGNTVENTITGFYFNGTTDGVAPYNLYDNNIQVGVTTGNTLICGSRASTNTINPQYGIYAINCDSVKFNNNVIRINVGANNVTHYGIFTSTGTNSFCDIISNNISDTSMAASATTTQFGIVNTFGASGTNNTVNINNNTVANCLYNTPAAATATYIQNLGGAYTININGNTVQNNFYGNGTSTATGNITGILQSTGNTAAGASLTINGNNVNNLNRSQSVAGLGQTMGIQITGASNVMTISNNNVNNITNNVTSSTTSGIHNSASATTVLNLFGNTVHTILKTAGSTTGVLYGIFNSQSAPTQHVYNNTVYNVNNSVTTNTGAVYGYYDFGLSSTLVNFYGNTIYNINNAGTSTIHGAFQQNGTVPTKNVYNNLIYNITGGTAAGGGQAIGLSLAYGTTTNCYNNRVYNITSYSTTLSPAAAGIAFISSGTTHNVYNNFIHEIKAPQSSVSVTGVIGLWFNVGATANVYYNTIYLDGTSSAAGFGSSALWTITSLTIDLRNNILINKCTPTGTGIVSAYTRQNTTLGTHATTSNNNNFFAGTPSPQNLIYHDYTNSDQTLAAFKTRVAPRENNSVTENTTFVNTTTSPYDLHISTCTPSQCESGAQSIAGYTTDIDGNNRYPNAGHPNCSTFSATAPDIGADEFGGDIVDLVPPVISYTPLPNDVPAVSRSFTGVSITDAGSGVNVTTGTKPRCYYKKSTHFNGWGGTNDNTTNGWKWVEATGTSSPFDFTIDYTRLFGGGVVIGDIIQYFVVAQDLATTPNVAINSGTFSGSPANVGDYANIFPLGGTINQYYISALYSGTYNVGTFMPYPTLTGPGGFFEAINAGIVVGDITVNIVSDLSEPGTHALNAVSYIGGPFTIKIVPFNAPEKLISGSVADAMIRFNGADRVTIDGDNGLGGRYLRFRNSNGSFPTFAFLNDASLDTIQNCFIESNNTNTATTAAGTILFGTTTGTNGNDNIVFQNCDIRDNSDASGTPLYAVYSSGTIASPNDNVTFSNCNFYNFYMHAGFASAFFLLDGTGSGWTITQSSFYQTATRTTTAPSGWNIIFTSSTGINNMTITNNYFGGTAPNCGGSPWTVTTVTSGATNFIYPIRFATAGATTASTISGNTIQNMDITVNNHPTAGSLWFDGILIQSGAVNITNNTIGTQNTNGNIRVQVDAGTLSWAFFGIDHRGVSGVISNNNIGSFTAAGTNTGGCIMVGINQGSTAPTSAINITNNLVGGTVANSMQDIRGGTALGQITGIRSSHAGAFSPNYTGNTIRNMTDLGTGGGFICGISHSGAASAQINNNTIHTLNSASSLAGSFGATFTMCGISLTSSAINQSINGNTIYNINSTHTGTSNTYVHGIQVTSSTTSGTINANKIYRLTNQSTGTSPHIMGINMYWGAAGFITSNNQITITNGELTDMLGGNINENAFFRDNRTNYEPPTMMNLSSSNNNDKRSGSGNNISGNRGNTIDMSIAGPVTVNEEPVLQNPPKPESFTDDPEFTNGITIYGIFNDATAAQNYYYNSVYVGGSASSGAANSYTFRKTLPTHILRNNLFVNARVNTGTATGKHYVMYSVFTTAGTINTNYNTYIGSNATTIGLWGSTDQTITQWRTSIASGPGQDKQTWSTVTSSFNVSNLFEDITNGDLNIKANNQEAWIVNGKGIAVTGFGTDYNGNTRSTTISGGVTDIGSHEVAVNPIMNPPPLAFEDLAPGSGVTSTYSLWSRNIAVVNWGTGGSSYPSTLNVRYYSGVLPPAFTGNYSSSHWDITAVGSLTGATYNIQILFGDNEVYTITTPATNTILAKHDGTWEVFPPGSGPWQSLLTYNTTNQIYNVLVNDLWGFSIFALTDNTNPLPVIISQFDITVNQRNANLIWVTEREINNKGFAVERRIKTGDNQYSQWKEIAFVDGHGTTNEQKIYKYEDKKLNSGIYQYRLKQVDYNGNFEYYERPPEVADVVIGKPVAFDLGQNYPNPSNPKSKIDFALPFDAKVTVKLYDILGREVATMIDAQLTADYYTLEFDGSNLASGTYFYRIIADNGKEKLTKTMKMILVK